MAFTREVRTASNSRGATEPDLPLKFQVVCLRDQSVQHMQSEDSEPEIAPRNVIEYNSVATVVAYTEQEASATLTPTVEVTNILAADSREAQDGKMKGKDASGATKCILRRSLGRSEILSSTGALERRTKK